MQFSPLSLVKHRVAVGTPLPFNVRHADTSLLLARGQVITSAEQMAALFNRGALVDLAELTASTDMVALATPTELPRLWQRCLGQLADSLRQAEGKAFVSALESATPPVLALVERDKDLAIFQVLRQEGNAHVQYGVNHSLHTAITGYLVAQRLGWTADDAQRVFKVGLTMNVAMLELQGLLANQTEPLTRTQRAAIDSHPTRSRLLLQMSGVTDPDWLQAVEQHHEQDDGSGYPAGATVISDIAALVRRADIYTAKLSPRRSRDAMAADKAGRTMFMQDGGHPMSAALIKEFGVYPPGCWVRLASGETGVVVKRGSTVMTPIVAVMTTTLGSPLTEPIRRDTTQPAHAVHGVLGAPVVGRASLPADKLVALAMA